MTSMIRTRWAAIGAAVAVTLGGGGIAFVAATSPAGAAAFVPITPCRVMDTRPAPDTVGLRSTPIAASDTHTVTVHGNNGECTGIPSSATGVQLNVTAVGASTLTFLTIWETGKPQPDASSLNPSPGQPPTPNAVTTAVSTTGQFNIFNKFGSVNVLADITGYYVDHHHDDRYYTKAEVDTRFEPVITELSYGTGLNTVVVDPAFRLVRTFGTFDKSSASTLVRVDWVSHIASENTATNCSYQLRIDSRNSRGSTATSTGVGRTGFEVVVTELDLIQTVSTSEIFEDLAAGTHTVQLYLANSVGSCFENPGNYLRSVRVEEYGAR